MSALFVRQRAVPLDRRLRALTTITELGEGRLDPQAISAARGVLARAGERLRMSGEHTVVALAGATGSGKSSLFNALAGLELSRVGVQRPTTAEALACVWGPEGAGSLLEWLKIPRSHQIERESVLDDEDTQADLHGLVLLDLPDHDSTAAAHRVEVDRLVQMVDLFVWVLDPQKYADAAIHDRYLRPLAAHSAVTIMVLNQIDLLAPDDAQRCRADLERLLREDGLADVPVIATSATAGDGLDELRKVLVERVAEKRSAGERLIADLDHTATLFAGVCSEHVPEVGDREKNGLTEALVNAAGVPAVADAVEKSHRYQAVVRTGWPVTRWVKKLRPDPLRRLHLAKTARSSLPAATPVLRSGVYAAVRRVSDSASTGLPRAWVDAIRRASLSREPELPDALDVAVTGTDLGVSRRPLWMRTAALLQWLLVFTALAGGLWLAGLFGASYLKLPEPPTPKLGEVPYPTLMLVGGLVLGWLLAMVCRIPAAVGSRRRRARAEKRLRAAIVGVGEEYVLGPVAEEVGRYREVCESLAILSGDARE